MARTDLQDVAPLLEPAELIMTLLAVAGGSFAAAVILPTWLPGLRLSLTGSNPQAYWYLARAAGFVAYVVLWFSLALGLIVTNKMARLWNRGPTAVDLHQFTTWLAIGLTVFHMLILLGDHYIQSTPGQVLMPFGYSQYKPVWVGIGQVAFYLAVVVAGSFYFRKRIGYRSWRLLHYVSYVVYVLINLHGILAGTDSPALVPAYILLGAAIYFLTMYRILQGIKAPPPAGAVSHARPPSTAARPPSGVPAPLAVPTRLKSGEQE